MTWNLRRFWSGTSTGGSLTARPVARQTIDCFALGCGGPAVRFVSAPNGTSSSPTDSLLAPADAVTRVWAEKSVPKSPLRTPKREHSKMALQDGTPCYHQLSLNSVNELCRTLSLPNSVTSLFRHHHLVCPLFPSPPYSVIITGRKVILLLSQTGKHRHRPVQNSI